MGRSLWYGGYLGGHEPICAIVNATSILLLIFVASVSPDAECVEAPPGFCGGIPGKSRATSTSTVTCVGPVDARVTLN